MKSQTKIGLAALLLLGGTLSVAQPAAADNVTIGVAVPGIAFGYDDGYWDRDRHWHEWHNREEAARWREENREHYFAWRHDRDHDHDAGWRDSDRWWDHH